MTESFQGKLHQEECKQLKGANICASIRMELDCEICSKTFCKGFASQNMQNQTNPKYSSNCEDIFKSNKNIENLNTKDDSSNTNTFKVSSKTRNRKKLQINNTNFSCIKFL